LALIAGEEQIEIAGAAARASLFDHLADGDAEILPSVFLFDRSVGDQFAELRDTQRFANFVDREAHVAGNERRIAGVHARRGQLLRIRGAIQI